MPVIAELRVMPKDSEVDLNAIIREIKEKLGPVLRSVREDPIGFGITALRLTLVVEDSEGGIDPFEDKVKGVLGVGEVDVTSLDLV